MIIWRIHGRQQRAVKLANSQQLSILAKGLEVWNAWRKANPQETIDLSRADLHGFDLLSPALEAAVARGLIPKASGWSFIMSEIIGYDVMPLNLRSVNLRWANLEGANLRKADCAGSDFSGASLRNAHLGRADLSKASFIGADLTGAVLRGAQMFNAVLLQTIVEGADFGYCEVYGISVWDLAGTVAGEENLLVSSPGAPNIRIDSLNLAQLINYLSRHEHARDLIDTISHRMVLILGNFKESRKTVLDAIADAFRKSGFLPIIFDFDGPASKDTTGTVETLARLAGLVIADLTDPSSVPHELATTVPFLRTTPVVLLRKVGASGYSMVADLQAYPWVLGIHSYESAETLVQQLPDIINRAQTLFETLRSS